MTRRPGHLVLLLILTSFSFSLAACVGGDDDGGSVPPDAHVRLPDAGGSHGAHDAGPGEPDGAPPVGHSCTGTPFTCDELTASTCVNQVGCSGTQDHCDGESFSCSSYFDSFGCSLQAGCFWESTFCGGVPDECSTQPGISSCDDLEGCHWTFGTCAGTPQACEALGESACVAQLGCFWN